MDFLKNYSASDLFNIAFAFTFVVLGLVASTSVGVFKSSYNNLNSAKKAMNGLLALTMFALGKAFADFQKSGLQPGAKMSVNEMLSAAATLTLFILAVTAYGAVQKGNIQAAQRSMKGILSIAVIGLGINVWHKSKSMSYSIGSGSSFGFSK